MFLAKTKGYVTAHFQNEESYRTLSPGHFILVEDSLSILSVTDIETFNNKFLRRLLGTKGLKVVLIEECEVGYMMFSIDLNIQNNIFFECICKI